jgi:hypothetical protein
MEIEIKAAAENVLAEQADFLCLFDCGAESEYRKGVFGTDIDITFGCAAGNCCDHHTFEHTVRVAFHDAPVHECAGVALVAVADNVFLFGFLCFDLCPLFAGGEAAAASAAELGLGDFVNDIIGSHVEQSLFKSGVTADAEIFLDGKCINVAAVFKNDAGLVFVEGNFFLFPVDFAVALICKPVDGLVVENRFFNDFFAIGKLNLGVEVSLGFDANKGTHFAEAVAAALFHCDAVIGIFCLSVTCALAAMDAGFMGFNLEFDGAADAVCFDEFFEPVKDLQ